MAEARILTSIDAIAAERWNGCFVDGLEDHACLRAIERGGLPGFLLRYIVVEDGADLLAAMPMFVTHYRVDTMIDGRDDRIVQRLQRRMPGLFAPRLACIGSPCLEAAGIGFAPELRIAARRAAGVLALDALARIATMENCALIGLKDLAETERWPLADGLRQRGFLPAGGQASASLRIDFDDLDGYFKTLSRATRKSLRRKLRGTGAVRIERRTAIDDVADRVHQLYRETLARATHRFEELTPAYFAALLREMAGRACCMLYYVDDELLGANFLIQDRHVLLDKYWCMADRGRDHGLFHLSWITNIRHCIDEGLLRYIAGQAQVNLKRSLGCAIDPGTTYVRHRHGLLNHALRLAMPLLGWKPAESAVAA